MADRAETELRFQGLTECPMASFKCKGDVPGRRFPFRPDIDLWVSKRYDILTVCKEAANMQISLKTLHALVDVERGAERGGSEVNPES